MTDLICDLEGSDGSKIGFKLGIVIFEFGQCALISSFLFLVNHIKLASDSRIKSSLDERPTNRFG